MKITPPDPIYGCQLVTLLVHQLLREGKKTRAQRIVYQVIDEIHTNTQTNPLHTLREAVNCCTPTVEVKSKRIGGSIYQVPREVSGHRGTSLALRWLVTAAQNRSERTIVKKLANEIIDASNHSGNARRKKDEIHRMAEANKAFAHHRFSI